MNHWIFHSINEQVLVFERETCVKPSRVHSEKIPCLVLKVSNKFVDQQKEKLLANSISYSLTPADTKKFKIVTTPG